MVRTHIWSSSGRAAACGKPTPDQFVKDCIPWVGPHSTGDESDQEGAAEKKCCRLTITPIPPFPCAARREEVEEGGWGGRCFWFLSFVSHFSSLLVMSNKSYYLSSYAESGLPVTLIIA